MRRSPLWELLYPTKCIFCCQLVRDYSKEICPACECDLPEIHKLERKIPFSCGCTALWQYNNLVRESLLRFKFSRKRHYARFYGQALAQKLLTLNIQADVITWVPVSTRRKLRRGYDQGELLAQILGHQMDLPVQKCLKKTVNNPPQSTLNGEALRKANVLGIYKPIHKSFFCQKRVLLIDDIITTGATISECAKVLMMGGAKEVYCAAVAASKKS